MDKIITWIKPVKKPNPAKDSGINYDEIWEFYPEFFDKCSTVLKGGSEKSKAWIKSILDFLQDWDSLTWAQFASVFKPFNKNWAIVGGDVIVFAGEYVMVFDKKIAERFNRKTARYYVWVPTTDRELDELYKKVYKVEPRFWQVEQKGYRLTYNQSGKRVFHENFE